MTWTLSELGTLMSLIIAALAFYKSFVENAKAMGRMELKVDTLWDFQMRRAATEAVRKGIATKNSPVTVTDEAKQWMGSLVEPIKEFYAKLGRRMSERELYFEIERRFGERIYQEVCVPHNLDQGACLLIAVQAAQSAMK